MKNKYAYCTVITQDKYIPCLIRQKQRMDYLGCKYPFIVLITEEIFFNNEEIFNGILGIDFRIIESKQFTVKDGNYADTFNKFQILQLTDFDKVLFLDADAFFIDNFDYMFEKYEIEDRYNFFFFGDYRENDSCCTIDGTTFLCKPSDELYDYIFNKNIRFFEKHMNDEQVFNKYFYNEFKLNLTKELPKLAHFAGIVKLWEFANVNEYLNKIFYSMSAEEFNKAIDDKEQQYYLDYLLSLLVPLNDALMNKKNIF